MNMLRAVHTHHFLDFQSAHRHSVSMSQFLWITTALLWMSLEHLGRPLPLRLRAHLFKLIAGDKRSKSIFFFRSSCDTEYATATDKYTGFPGDTGLLLKSESMKAFCCVFNLKHSCPDASLSKFAAGDSLSLCIRSR